jgi:DMSO/TMAO reductase YedYZ molybdopterin-dependent catalytic subunit
VILIGADRGTVDAGKKTASPGAIAFARSLPIGKAMSDSVILAHSMNGEPLTKDHGFPLRAVVGGWFGMAWVKWISEIRVVTQPFLGYWQARDYFRWDRSLGEPRLVPLSEIAVKSQIAQPVNGATVRAGSPVRIFGAAWSGEAPISAVEVDTGDRWRQATLLGNETAHAWRLWEYFWTPGAAGDYALRCRATDRAGNVQPDRPSGDCESYVANWVVPVEVKAVALAEAPAPDYVI